MKIKSSLENLREALRLVELTPDYDLNLRMWRRPRFDEQTGECGTMHCIAGLCAISPFFREQGMHAGSTGSPSADGCNGLDEVLEAYFGSFNNTESFYVVFAHFGGGEWDAELLEQLDPHHDVVVGDKKLAIARLQKAIAIREAEVV